MVSREIPYNEKPLIRLSWYKSNQNYIGFAQLYVISEFLEKVSFRLSTWKRLIPSMLKGKIPFEIVFTKERRGSSVLDGFATCLYLSFISEYSLGRKNRNIKSEYRKKIKKGLKRSLQPSPAVSKSSFSLLFIRLRILIIQTRKYSYLKRETLAGCPGCWQKLSTPFLAENIV